MEILRSLSIDRHSMFNYSKPSFYPNPHFMNVDFTGNQNDYLKKIPLKINVANLKPKIDFSNEQLKELVKDKKLSHFENETSDKNESTSSTNIFYKTIFKKKLLNKQNKEINDKSNKSNSQIKNNSTFMYESIKPKYHNIQSKKKTPIKLHINPKNNNDDKEPPFSSKGTQCINDSSFSEDSKSDELLISTPPLIEPKTSKYLRILKKKKKESINMNNMNNISKYNFFSLNNTKTPSDFNRDISTKLPKIKKNLFKGSSLTMYKKYSSLILRYPKMKYKLPISKAKSQINIYEVNNIQLPFNNINELNKDNSSNNTFRSGAYRYKYPYRSSRLNVKGDYTVDSHKRKKELFIDLARISNIVYKCNNCDCTKNKKRLNYYSSSIKRK